MTNPVLSGQIFTRTEILERAKRGEISPTDAENWAKENGLEPFATCPTVIAREALKSRFWTLPMTVLWIATRNLDAVREVDPEYVKQCQDWRAFELSSKEGGDSHPRFGWEVLPRRLDNLPSLQFQEAWDSPTSETQGCSLFDATKQLKEQLRGGTIACVATGTDGFPAGIPAIEWSKLNFVTDRNGADIARLETNINHIYQHLEFDSFVVLKIWPSSGSSADEGPLEPAKASLRAALLYRVRCGEMSPSEAEAEAEKLGIGPLATKPDDALFDPLAEPRWTLAMAAAWIMWRTPSEARAHWDDYRFECWDFCGVQLRRDGVEDGTTFSLDRRQPITISDAFLEAPRHQASRIKLFIEPEQARLDLWSKLKSGKIQAYGIPNETHSVKPIPAYEWDNLTHEYTQIGYADSIASATAPRNTPPIYDRVRVARDDILREWPAIPIESGEIPKTAKRVISAGEQQKLATQLREYNSTLPKPLGVSAGTAWLQSLNPNLNRELARNMVRGINPDATTRGRPRKKAPE